MNFVVKVKSEIIDSIIKKDCSYFVTKIFPQRYDKNTDVVFIVNQQSGRMIGFATEINVFVTSDVKPVMEGLRNAVGKGKSHCLAEYIGKKRITIWELQSITLVIPAPLWKSTFHDKMFPVEYYNTKINPNWFKIQAYNLMKINF